jgi:putative SOS response-associated peptidase YedK
MCYSAQVESKWKRHVRDMEARIAYSDFLELARLRLADPTQYRLPRGFDLEFADPQNDEERTIKGLSDQYRKAQITILETEIFAQKKRLADAERKLAGKETKAATESKRIAETKVKQAMGKLALLTDDRPHSNDYRIFPRSYAPIILVRNGEKVMVPARYLLRQPGKPAFMDDKLSGNYNARRDNLTKFWRREFGATHAVMAIRSFYENVTGADGHDRMVIRLTPANVERWLTPQGRSDEELQAILGERQPAYYEHRGLRKAFASKPLSVFAARGAYYAARSASTGVSRAARSAGSAPPSNAIAVPHESPSATSCGETCKRNDHHIGISRLSKRSQAIPLPMAAPASDRVTDSTRTEADRTQGSDLASSCTHRSEHDPARAE